MGAQSGSLAVTVALLGAVLVAGAAVARPVQIYNNSDFAMIQLQAKPAHTRAWTENLIAKYSLGVGKTQAARLQDAGCAYDFLATYDDGHKAQRLAVNVCRPGAIEFN
jgi:hypothetical protein